MSLGTGPTLPGSVDARCPVSGGRSPASLGLRRWVCWRACGDASRNRLPPGRMRAPARHSLCCRAEVRSADGAAPWREVPRVPGVLVARGPSDACQCRSHPTAARQVITRWRGIPSLHCHARTTRQRDGASWTVVSGKGASCGARIAGNCPAS